MHNAILLQGAIAAGLFMFGVACILFFIALAIVFPFVLNHKKIKTTFQNKFFKISISILITIMLSCLISISILFLLALLVDAIHGPFDW